MDPRSFVFVALSGESLYGASSGVVIVDPQNQHAKFTLVDEIEPRAFGEKISDEMQRHPENLYIVNKDANNLHVFTYQRERALIELKKGELPMS